MKRRELLTGLAAAALASGCTSQAPSRVHSNQARYGSPVPLPSPPPTRSPWRRPSGSAGPCVPSGQIPPEPRTVPREPARPVFKVDTLVK